MRRILVATDFSTRSDRALRRAVLIAGKHGAGMMLVHVVDDDQPDYLVRRHREAARELLGQTAKTVTEIDQVPAEVVVAAGEAFAGILRTADELQPDLIVIGPHRRQFLDTFIGTTAERTIRRSRRPVLMANAVPSGQYERSLLAVDFDQASRSAVETALHFGLLGDTEVTALHLFDAPGLGLMKRAMAVPSDIDDYVEDEEQHARAEFAAFLSNGELNRAHQLFRRHEGSAAAAIRSCADEMHADLIVMGTNQRTGFQRFLLGSVAQEVLLDAVQDVLVVPTESQIG